MRPGGGKSKGSAFEREQAKIVSLWVSSNKDDSLFWRSSNSGGRASQGQVKGTQYGDLTIQKPTKEAQQFYSNFSVELKRYKKFDILQGWLSEKSDLRKWWEQCKAEAIKNNVLPMLIVKPDRGQSIIIFENDIIFNSLYIVTPPESGDLSISTPTLNIIMYLQEDFFKYNSWKNIYKCLKKAIDKTKKL